MTPFGTESSTCSCAGRCGHCADTQRARVQGGALLNALDSAALEKGMITTAGVVSHTGCGGFTLGGGFGRLNRKYGLTVDNVTGARIITADGRHLLIGSQRPDGLADAILSLMQSTS